MQEDLSRLTNELRKETCPQRVNDEVQRRIAARGVASGWLRRAMPAAAAVLVMVGCVWTWHWHAGGKARQEAAQAEQERTRVQIAFQAEGALGLIGSVLANAGAESERVISERAVPPLRNSLQTANNKISHYIQL
jgi:anti-sigma factor RsiW